MAGIRTWLLVGAGFGLGAALAILLLNGTGLAFLLEAVLAVAAGGVAAYLTAPAAVAAPPGSAGAPRTSRMRNGVSAGAAVGVLAGVSLLVVSGQMIYSPAFRD